MDLNGTRTAEHLREAFARASMANLRYQAFAEAADVEGLPAVAAGLREAAAGSVGHANGLLDYLIDVGDPTTGLPIGETADNLGSAAAGEAAGHAELYPAMAEAARQDGFTEIADWFDTLARAAEANAKRFRKLLDDVE